MHRESDKHLIEGVIRIGQGFSQPLHKENIRESCALRFSAALLKHFRCHINPDNPPNVWCSSPRNQSGASSNIKHSRVCREVEVADDPRYLIAIVGGML